MQNQEVIGTCAIEDHIGIAQDWHPAMTRIVNETANKGKKAQCIDRRLDGAEHIGRTGRIMLDQISGDALKIA